jgi:hypothetical protein
MSRILALVALFTCGVFLRAASAQSTDAPSVPSRTTAAEATIGYTGFGDDGLIHHTGTGATVRVHLTPRISVGPEISYHIGPSRDRDLLVQGLVYFDLRRPSLGHAGRVEPYVVAGGGLMGHDSGYGSSGSLTATTGGGARVWVSRQAYVVADARLGWPPNLRVVTGMGLLLR